MTLERATRVLRDAVGDGGDVSATPTDRDETIDRIAAALRKRARERERRRRIGGLALAAGLVLASAAYLTHRAPAPPAPVATELGQVNDPSDLTAVRGGVAEPVNAGSRIAEGTELRTPTGAEAHLVFDTGTRVTIGSGTRVRLVEQTKRKRFAVETGSLHARVSKLVGDERFVVSTPDAEVEVHGTVFRVSVVAPDPGCGGGTPTRLDVTEGVVVLRHDGSEIRVAAGEHWPVCDVAPATAPAPSASVVVPAPRPRAVPSSAASASAPAPPSALGDQNDLFAEGMREKRAGDSARAIASFEQLLAKYPQGPLVESASIERMRLLQGAARTQAARDYLGRWPNGAARAEADAIVRAGP